MNKYLNYSIVSLLVLQCTNYANADKIYTWKDKSGTTVYSSQPNPNAKQAKLKPLNVINPPSVDTHSSFSTANPNNINLNLLYPKANQTIQRPGNKITLIVKNLSLLTSEKKVIVALDGTPITPLSIYQDMIDITTPPPGKHTLSISTTNEKGETLCNTQPVTFFIQPNRRREQVGSIPTNASRYEASTGSNPSIENNMTKFYNDHKKELIRPQKPNTVQGNWKAYKQQVSP